MFKYFIIFLFKILFLKLSSSYDYNFLCLNWGLNDKVLLFSKQKAFYRFCIKAH